MTRNVCTRQWRRKGKEPRRRTEDSGKAGKVFRRNSTAPPDRLIATAEAEWIRLHNKSDDGRRPCETRGRRNRPVNPATSNPSIVAPPAFCAPAFNAMAVERRSGVDAAYGRCKCACLVVEIGEIPAFVETRRHLDLVEAGTASRTLSHTGRRSRWRCHSRALVCRR